ncbi:hypothetical protein HYPSUDRAFT_59833 [Hypholoma sublateritium FD-334 SS-4]|uniref:Chromo domain-containing protein n=1 Tax=Hypholoma sublateritium (strain FD-334 SS-4) TaxID=945553 RepID=A0A0D2N2R9_HYPSF|nr:hypothetical protein HYPSUDRAFT_59833 [Hypholoma sublateritium FD-334 SS-4]
MYSMLFSGCMDNQIGNESSEGSEWAVDRILEHTGSGTNSKFEIQWQLGDITWLPYDKISHLEALNKYINLLGATSIGNLPAGKAKPPLEDLQIHLGTIMPYFTYSPDYIDNCALMCIGLMSYILHAPNNPHQSTLVSTDTICLFCEYAQAIKSLPINNFAVLLPNSALGYEDFASTFNMHAKYIDPMFPLQWSMAQNRYVSLCGPVIKYNHFMLSAYPLAANAPKSHKKAKVVQPTPDCDDPCMSFGLVKPQTVKHILKASVTVAACRLEAGNGFFSQRECHRHSCNHTQGSFHHASHDTAHPSSSKKAKHTVKAKSMAKTQQAAGTNAPNTPAAFSAVTPDAANTPAVPNTTTTAAAAPAQDVKMPDADALTALTPAALAKFCVTEDGLMSLLAGLVSDNSRIKQMVRNLLAAILNKGSVNNDIDADGDDNVDFKDANTFTVGPTHPINNAAAPIAA